MGNNFGKKFKFNFSKVQAIALELGVKDRGLAIRVR